MDGPYWLDVARKYVGVTEIPGKTHNQTILSWWERLKMPFRDDETPWCAAFVGAVLEEAGYKSTRSAAARSYVNYGNRLTHPAVGAVVVFWRGSPTGWSGHVGFIVGKDHDRNLMVLGGNQKNMVRIDPFSRDRVLAYRWPGTYPHVARYSLPVLTSTGKVSVNEA